MARRKRGSISGYFRQIFADHPDWIKAKRNSDVMALYRTDHGMKEDAPIKKNILQGMANVKSALRKQSRKRSGVKLVKVKAAVSANRLEALEELIDECMSMAKTLDRSGLEDVIRNLRRARNGVILKLG